MPVSLLVYMRFPVRRLSTLDWSSGPFLSSSSHSLTNASGFLFNSLNNSFSCFVKPPPAIYIMFLITPIEKKNKNRQYINNRHSILYKNNGRP